MTRTISTTVIQLASSITLGDVHLGEVADASDLDIVRSLDKMNAFQGAVGDGTRATTRLGTPGDLDALSIADGAFISCKRRAAARSQFIRWRDA